MAKGVFSQGIAVLFDRVPALDDLANAIAPHEVVRRLEESAQWAFGGAFVRIRCSYVFGGSPEALVLPRRLLTPA